MELISHFRKLQARLRLVERLFLDFDGKMPMRLERSHWMYLEGLSSATWQYWSLFCRSVVVDSALGATTAKGVPLEPCAGSWEEVSHVASKVAKSLTPTPGGTNSKLHIEPTWGDPHQLNIVIGALNLGNKETLAQSFGADSFIPHLQTVRNAAAHRHHQNTAKVLELRPYYQVSRLRHPSEAMLWREEQTKSAAFLFWLEDMRIIGEHAVQ